MKRSISFVIVFLVFISLGFAGFDFGKIKSRVSEFTLDNGLKFILMEDHSVPIASFVTYANVGSSDEKIGIWGISHFLEHMAFKGTSEIGTTNIKAESKIMAEMDRLFDRILTEKNSIKPDQDKIKQWTEELNKLKEEAGKYVSSDGIDAILKRNGGVGLNAMTSWDQTIYFFSLPSNRAELWAYMESSRFFDPVFREFYKEREVIREERRVRVDNSPFGKLLFEELPALAFKFHPYGINAIGPMNNIENISRADMIHYFRSNYTARNLVIGVIGDIYPEQLKKLAKKYFSKLRPGKKNPRLYTLEPKQLGEKTLTIYEDSQPWLVIGYHCPSSLHEDFLKFNVLDYILTNGRSSRLSKKMVKKDKSALFVFSFAGYPGSKYDSLYLVAALPNQGHSTQKLQKTIFAEIEDLKKNPVSDEELQSAKIRFKVNTLRRMKNEQFFLIALLQSEMVAGSWKKAFDDLDTIEKITASDIQKIVDKYFSENNRVIARIEKKKEVKK